MRELPVKIIQEKNKQQNTPISLLMAEISSPYVFTCQEESNKTQIRLPSVLRSLLSTNSIDITESGIGHRWVLSVERGNNVGVRRPITTYNGATGVITLTDALDHMPINVSDPIYNDRIRISRYMFLACWDRAVSFFLPYRPTGVSIAETYIPFPIHVTSAGTNASGEVLSMQVALSNANLTIGNAIQKADGLRGNRIIHIQVFGYQDGDTFSIINDDKDHCILDVMYVDSAKITNSVVDFIVESRFNIVNIQLPLCTYNRNFCRAMFASPECGWTYALKELDLVKYPMADYASCDHSLNGHNGCMAHNNTERFGGSPAIPA